MAVTASSEEADAFVEALGDLVRGLGLRVRVERRPNGPPESSWPNDVVVGVWIDARAPDRVDVRMTSAGRGVSRTSDRSIAREGSTAVVADEVAQVVRASLESILASAPEELAEAPASPVSSAPPAVEVEPHAPSSHGGQHGFGLDFAAFGSERAMSARSGPVFGVGAAFAVSAGRAPWRPSLWISAAYDSRFDVQSGSATFDVGTDSFRLIPSVELLALDTMQVDLGVGGGLDLSQVAPLVVRASQAIFDTPTRFVDPVLSAQLLLRLRLASQIGMLFGFDLDYDCALHTTSFPDDHPRGPHGTFEPWRVRPAIEFGLCIPLSNGSACAKPH